jgi:two-component system, sensor histidine kinase and response regulator
MFINPEKIKILIAEDDFLIADEIARISKKLGYQLIGVASNGIKAVEMTLSQQPDIVIMDIKMPKMDGLEAARKIIDAGSSSAIIILTAHESSDLVEEAGKSGIAAYLTKPPKAEEIERAVYIAFARQCDLLESRRLIKELEEHKQQLAELNSTKDKFFSILAHDMRNPVSALYTFSNHINTNKKEISTSDLHEYLSVIHTTAKSLSELLEELFLWANLKSNRCNFMPDTLLLLDVVTSINSLLMANAIQKSIKLANKVDPQLQIYADRNMVQTILRNLITNAIKFTPQNGTITIEAIENLHEVWITIRDNGVGINEEDVQKLFRIDTQFRGEGTNGEQGSGLGLVLCKELVEKNDGRIWVESEPERGSSFTFALPKYHELQIQG